jgi:hypothetical protein
MANPMNTDNQRIIFISIEILLVEEKDNGIEFSDT